MAPVSPWEGGRHGEFDSSSNSTRKNRGGVVVRPARPQTQLPDAARRDNEADGTAMNAQAFAACERRRETVEQYQSDHKTSHAKSRRPLMYGQLLLGAAVPAPDEYLEAPSGSLLALDYEASAETSGAAFEHGKRA